MKNNIIFIVILLSPLLFSGCTVKTFVVPYSENIKISNNSHSAKSCKFRGRVSVAKSEIYSPTHTSVEETQLNTLKNQAAKLGANTIILISHKTKYWPHPEYIIGEGKMQWELDAHSMNGLAYSCPKPIHSKISQKKGELSDVRTSDE